MAYANLDSLTKVLDTILDHQTCRYCFGASDSEHCILLQKKQQIERLYENSVFLSDFLGDFARDAKKLHERISNTATQSRTLFERRILVDHQQAFCQDLEKLIAETDSIREEAIRIKSSVKIAMQSRVASDGNGTVVGIEEDLLEIKSRLCSGESRLQIIPIVGMGGIGKTTLARYAYKDPYSVHHFDVRVWLKISQKYELRGVLLSVLRSIKKVFEGVVEDEEDECEYLNDELLRERVYRYLKGRRYLIAMDDMWDTNLWDEMQRMFPDDVNGSRIVITTRELSVASYIDSRIHPHEMHLMDVDKSWCLLKEKVFGMENCPLELEKIGQVIAEKCRGLPLAIVVIAGVLSYYKANRMKESWEKIAINVSKAVYTNNDAFTEILSLSYEFLPSRLRPCFLYMGCFPEDHAISVSKLIRLWGAEGFLLSNEMEELGYEFLEDLATRNLVLIDKRGSDGKITTVKIHDLLRDLCLRKCEDENFLCAISEFSGSFPQGIENSNRLSVSCNISGSIPNMVTSHMYAILLFQHWSFDSWKVFRLLKVLDGVTLGSSSSYASLGELIHLRYLALMCEPIRKTIRLVSEALYQLRNLQTLIVGIIRKAEIQIMFFDEDDLNQWYMEFEIWRMPNLRHLMLLDCFLPDPCAESTFSYMENLHTLSRVRDFKCSKSLLEMIPNLRKLGVVYSYEGTYENGWSEYCLNNLARLHRLEKLSLYAEPYPNLKDDLPQNIAFPIALKKLSLSGCRLPWEEMKLIGLLPDLEVLKLKRHAFHGSDWETSEGEFCQLKVLLIDSTDLLQWATESSHFPKLQRLTLYECDNLREIPLEFGDITTLQLIEVDIRNSAVVESAKCIEEEQQSFGNELLQIRILKSRSWGNFTSR